MKKWKSLLGISLAGMVLLAGCGTSNETGGEAKEGKQIKIGVTQIVEHPSLDAAYKGFKKAITANGLKNVKYDVQLAQGDPNNSQTIAKNLVGEKVDLIFANSTPSAQHALNATKDIPIVFTSVTDPVGAKLVQSFDKPGDNITGTTDTHPDAIPKTIEFIDKETDAKTVGLIYNKGEQNSVAQVDLVKKELKKSGLKPVEVSVSTSADVKQAAESLVGRADVFYIVTDNTVVSALESVISVAEDKDIPMFAGELDSVKRGAFAAYGFDYYDIGFEAGQMAAKILKGDKKAGELKVQYPQKLKLVINKKAAEAMNIKIKPDWDSKAEYTKE